MDAELTSEVGSGQFEVFAREWFAGTLERVFPELAQGLAAGPVLYKRDKRDAGDVPWGDPGAIWAQLAVKKSGQGLRGGRRTQYTVQGWRRFLDGLAACPVEASIDVIPLDGRGLPDHARTVYIAVERVAAAPGQWVRFRCMAREEAVRVPGTIDRWAEFVRERAVATDAAYGEIGYGNGSGWTALEYATRSWPEQVIPSAHEEVRGYTWVTIVPREIVRKLGGYEKLAASGTFHALAELGNGAVWLQATPDLGSYGNDAARRVFEVLAPVLIPGEALMNPGFNPPLAYGVNAEDYR